MENKQDFEVEVGEDGKARVTVGGNDVSSQLRRVSVDVRPAGARLKLELAPKRARVAGRGAVLVECPELRCAAEALMQDWYELEEGEHSSDEDAMVEVPIALMRALRAELDR